LICEKIKKMKNKFALLIAFILLSAFLMSAVFSSCKTQAKNENKPAAVATKFMRHLRLFEFEEARKLSTEATGKMLDMFIVMLELSKKNGKDAGLEKKDVDIEVVKTAIDGKNAVVTYKNEEGQEHQIELVKVKGKWLVNFKKEMPALSPGNRG